MTTRVKICGLTTPRDVDAAVRAGADAVGFVFADSPRACRPDEAADLVAGGAAVRHPGGRVRRSKPYDRVARIAETARLHVIQLHGEEDDRLIVRLRRLGYESSRRCACGTKTRRGRGGANDGRRGVAGRLFPGAQGRHRAHVRLALARGPGRA